MTDESNEHHDDHTDGEDRFSGWGVLGGTMSVVFLSPLVFVIALQGGWIGPIAALVFFAGLVYFLIRSGQRSLGFGIALGYVLITVFTGGICTGWNQVVL